MKTLVAPSSTSYLIVNYDQKAVSDDQACSDLIDRISGLYLWFSPSSPREDMLKRMRQHEAACIDVLIHEETGECVGFSVHYTEEFEGARVMFRGGTIVRDRSLGLYKKLLLQSLERAHPDFVVAMTQNPRVYESLRSLSGEGIAFPHPQNTLSESTKRIAQKFCKAPVDLDTLVVRNVYQEIRKDESFRTNKDGDVTEMFKALGENDGFFVIVPLKS